MTPSLSRPLALALAAALLPATAGPAAAPGRQVPYRLTETQHLLLRARVNGKGPFQFILDTGAPAVFLSKAAAAQAGVTAGADGWAALPMELEGGLALGSIPARIEEPPQLTGMNAMGLAGTKLDGVFGYNLLARYRLEFDLTDSTMEWTKLEFEPPPLQSLKEITGGKPPEALPGAGSLEAISRLAQLLLRRPPREVAYRGYLGLEVEDGATGPTVAAVLPGSPAAAAGLKAGDRLRQAAVAGAAPQAVTAATDLPRLAAGLRPGAEVVLEVTRGAEPLRLALRAGKEAL